MKLLLFILFLPLGLLAQIKNTQAPKFSTTDFLISLSLDSRVTAPLETLESRDNLHLFIKIDIHVEEILYAPQAYYDEDHIPKYLTTFSLIKTNGEFKENMLQKRLNNSIAASSMGLYCEDTLSNRFKSTSLYTNSIDLRGMANGFGPRIAL